MKPHSTQPYTAPRYSTLCSPHGTLPYAAPTVLYPVKLYGTLPYEALPFRRNIVKVHKIQHKTLNLELQRIY